MPEHIPQLDDLAAQAQEAPMLPAHEVRRLGDRRRTTRRAGLAVAAVGAVAALGVGVWAVTPLLRGADNPDWAASPSPTVSPTVSPTASPDPTPSPSPTDAPSPTAPAVPVPPTWANVPTAALMYPYGSSPLVGVLSESEAMGETAKGLCDRGEWGSPTTTLVRSFGIEGELPTYAIVLGYADEAAASEGFDQIHTAAVECESIMTEAGWDRVSSAEDTRLPFDGSTVEEEPTRAAYFFGMAVMEGEDVGVFNDTLVMQAGERVVWLVSTFEGMDNNCSVLANDDAGQCSFAKSMPEVLELLVK
ncbi:hypothetical protein H5398_06015 [Tessaracoccus sp. MC1679]|uniref:hypothetical protein n=1 Tax=Tessaracoccus sp. MC1679 TaxID=2760313 RepID=UPI0015FED18C|nr:hypothetical protein [Tessaracoccus sp. MC1679]MBB1515531.1 hypothetical protein [Tessaracoccus sp. MC1679]